LTQWPHFHVGYLLVFPAHNLRISLRLRLNYEQICAGNIGDITFMCRPAMLPMMKRGNEAIGSKVNFALENCLEIQTFAFSSCGKKAALSLR
jgi:hypothetical protein